MKLYPKIRDFWYDRLLDGLFGRFVVVLGIDLILIQTIGTSGFNNFLEAFKYYLINYSIGNNIVELIKFSLEGSIAKYTIPAILIILWLSKKKGLLRKFFYVYLFLVNLKFLIALLFLIAGLWNPTASGGLYLVIGCLTWITNVLIFATWYWLVDREQQKRLLQDKTAEINFLFTPTTSGLPRYENWVPSFFDYLFLSFNTSISFSQSNTGYLTKKGRILTMFQALIALIINIIIIARSVSLIGAKPGS